MSAWLAGSRKTSSLHMRFGLILTPSVGFRCGEKGHSVRTFLASWGLPPPQMDINLSAAFLKFAALCLTQVARSNLKTLQCFEVRVASSMTLVAISKSRASSVHVAPLKAAGSALAGAFG